LLITDGELVNQSFQTDTRSDKGAGSYGILSPFTSHEGNQHEKDDADGKNLRASAAQDSNLKPRPLSSKKEGYA